MAEIVCMGAAFRTEQIDALRSAAEPAGYAVRILDPGTGYAPDALEDCEILCGHCPEELLRNAKKLRWIQLTSAGVDRMADPSIYPHEGVVVTNATGVFGISIAEHLIMGTLMLLRKMPHYLARQREKTWRRAEGLRFLHGSRVTILGTGDLGGSFAGYCAAMGAHPVGVSRSGRAKPEFERVYPVDRLREAVRDADIVAACLPGTRETYGLISREIFAAMKPGVLFLNVGRGSTVDEDALIDGLRSGHIGGAVLDVFRQEPLPEDSPLWSMDHVILTPHMSGSGWDTDNIDRIYALFRDNLARYLAGEPLRNVVDLYRQY